MIRYITLLMKKTVYNRNNLRMLLAAVLVIFGICLMNLEANGTDNYRFRMERDFRHNTTMAEHSADPGLKDLYQGFADRYGQILLKLDEQDYRAMYDVQLEILNEQMEMQGYASPALNTLQRDIEVIETLQREELLQDSYLYPVMGVPFLVQCFENLFPYLLTLLNCFIFTGICTARYKEKVNVNRILPMNRNLDDICTFAVCFLVSLCTFAVMSTFAYLCAGTVSGFSSFRYPYIFYGASGTSCGTVGDTVMPVIVLYLLYTAFSFLVTGILSKLLRRANAVFLVSAVILLGIGYMTQVIEPMRAYAHILPTSYYNSMYVASGFCRQYVYQNPNMSFLSGLKILGLSVTVLAAVFPVMNIREQ